MNNKVSRRVVARAVAAKLLHDSAKRSHWIKVTAAYLMEQNMIDDVDLFLNDVAHELYDQSGHLFVDVTSAHKLTDSIRDELTRTLKSATGAHHVEFAEHVDPTLLGGLIARTPDAQLDASVRTKLKQLASL